MKKKIVYLEIRLEMPEDEKDYINRIRREIHDLFYSISIKEQSSIVVEDE